MADAETSPSAIEPSTGSQMPQKHAGSTTTISTISLQSGETRLVIALLQSAERLQLKVLEGSPEITHLGATLPQALALQRQHEEVILQLQSKQSPVEELLRQADQLISAQRPRAEVYAAMAESLGVAWKDVNSYLELRKHILDLNVSYQSRAEECIERMLALETACRDTNVPVEIEAVKNLLAKLHDFKRMMLEALMVTLQNGRALHEKISEIAAQGTLDSRPDKITSSANFTISQIEHWLEELHDRRKVLEVKWQSRKTQLEQCLSLSLLAKDLKELDEILFLRKEALQNTSVQMGDSASSAELILHEHRKLINEAREFQDRCLKITKATEKLTLGGHFAGEQATIQAYAVLNASVEYLEALEERDALLKQSVAFFRSSRTALTKLDQLEIQLTTTEHSLTNSSLVQLHFQVSKSLEEITSQPLQQGYSLLEAVGQSSPGAQGVKCTVQELENRKIGLDNLCTAHKEENIHLSKAFTTFLERQNELYSWLVSIAEAFLQGHQDLGSVLAMADDFLQLHQQLLKDLQNKGIEINEVLLTLPPILEKLNDDQRADIDEKVDTLHSHWLNLKTILESRIDLASLYVKFHSLAAELTNEFDTIEVEFRKGTDNEEEDMMSRIEQKWLYIQQMTGQLTNLGKLFIEESSKIGDPYLDVKRASLCVETLLEHFANRQLVITQSWGTWQTTITTEREFNVLWERNIRESDRIMEWISKIHSQLYPVLTGESTAAKIITKELEEKLRTIMPELKRAQTEIELRVKTAETLAMKGEHSGQKETIISKLMVLHNDLNDTATDYQILLQMLISLFKKLSEVEKTIENLQSQFNLTRLPNVCSELELLLKEHEASEQTILELFKFTQNESEQIINRIVQQEPEKAAEYDTERVKRLLEDKKYAWKSAWTARKLLLEEQQQLSQFDSDLQQINSNLSDLSKQLNTLKGQYGESLTSAKATSVAFVYFEKTIQLLENRIQTFMSTTEQILKSEHASSHVESKLNELQTKWSAFMNQVKKSRQLIDMNIEYFTLVEEGEKWFRMGSKLLITIARKSTAVRSPHEADQLLAEVENFLTNGELLQQERINKISSLAEELHGEEGSKQVTIVRNENKEMIDSFTIIRKELHILAQNLRAAEEQRERQKKEMEEAEAILATAKAEATAAKAAATAAEEARRAAETAAKVLQEAMPILEKIEAETTVISSRDTVEVIERLRKSPSPPSKRAKINDEEQRLSPPTFTVPLQDATVQEGQRFTFECRVAGFPVPEVIWYKDGISIQDNPDYRTSYDNGICTLAIEETFSEDSARFTCKATNSEGFAETCGTLSVQEAEPEEQLFPPVFTKRIEESSAKEGSTLYLMCTVEGNPLPTVQWFKNGTCIDNSSDYVITYNNGEAVIKFEEIFLEDQAEYTCKASNPLGTDKCSAKLTVEALELTESPVFVTPLSNIMARAGRKIQLECEVRGLPLPDLIWTQNAKIIKDCQDVKLQYDNGKGVLTIKEAFPKDAGVYKVVAKNIAGEASSSCNVSVKGRLPTETSDSEIASDFEPIKPSIQLSLKDVCVLEGEKVCLDCIIIGQPEPEVIWYRNNQPVKESSDFQLLFQGDRCTLVIHEAYLEDAGEYKVVAINSGGEASSKCDLTVKSALGDAEPVVNPQVVKETEVPQGTPPKFNRLLTDIVASEGDKVVLECSILGDPKPNVKWYLDNQELSDSTLKEYKEDGDGNVSLTLLRVESQDKGVYTIKASNAFGEAESVAKLTVNPLPQETHMPVQLEEKSIAPSFKELFADRTIPENTSTKFECVVTGKPIPKVEWSINNEPISSEDVLISTEGEQQVLTIHNVKKIHSGNVACVAENDAGKATCTARLNVVEPSIPSQMPTAENMESSQKEISFKQSIFSSQVIESQSLSTTVIREEGKHVTSRSEQTLQRIEQKSPVQVQIQKFKEVQRKTNESSDSEHQSFVSAINKEDSQDSSPSSYSTPTASPKYVRKSVPPRFITPLNGRIVDEGAQVILEGIIDGYPPPTVSWTKNNQELISLEGKLSIKYDHNRVEVILNDATVQDAGKYTCKVVNNVGSASSTADIVVKKTFLPPIFGRRLQARSVKEGERVVMEVEITGIPDPDVTWYKDGQQILSTVPDSSFRTKVQGNCYSLIIEKVSLDNSGQYLVKAVNSKGEAASMADIVVNKQESPTETIIKVVKEDIRESEIEKLIQPQIPVSEAATEVQHPPVTSTVTSEMHSNFTNTSFISEKTIISETTKTEKQTSIKLEHTPSPIFFKPDAHYEIPKEHTVLPQEEKENKTQVFAPTLPVTQEFKTELHIDEVVERNISSPFLPTSPVKEMQKEVECQSTTEEISPLKGDANAETSLLDQPVVKKILINLELEPTSIEDNSMTRENSVFEYKSVSPSMEQPELKAEYIEIKNENKELQENEVTPVEIVNDELRIHHTDTVQSSEDTGVETASVSKKQAYEFFINKIKEFEEENAKPIIKKPIKLPSQEVPRFTGSLNTGKEEQSHDQTMYYSSIPTELKLIPYTESKISEFQSDQSINIQCETQILHQQQSSDSFVEEFCVRHEPLLEIDNLSKSEIKTKSTDDASTQTKSSEEINKGISPIEVPIVSGNAFHPSVSEELQNQTSAKNIVFTSATKKENIIKNEATPSNTVETVVFPAVDDGTFLSKSTLSKTPELPKEAITTMQSYMDSVTFTSSKSTESLKHVSVVPEPISVPVLVPEPEPMYIEPTSSEFKGIQSETPEFSQMESQTSICVPTDTAIPPSQPMSLVKSAVHAFNSRSISEAVVNQEQIPIQPISSKPFQPFPSNTSSEGLEKEKMLKPFESKSELFVHTSSSSIEKSEIVRSVSPKPSAEGLAMEKLWIPQMTRELEITIPKPSVDQKHVDGVVSPKPSVEGLAMDKLWAHKHPDSSLKKIWPPPQHSENKPIIPWSTKATSEKMQFTVDSVVDQKEETVTVSHKSAAQMVPQSVPIPPPEPNSFQNSEAKEINPEVQQVPPAFWHGENLPPTSLLASESGSDALTVNAIIPASQPAPVVHYVANASVIHSAATINQEIRTTEIFRNTEIKEEKTEVSKLVHQSEITTNDLSSTADKYIINQYEEKKIQPVALNESFQAKSLSCVDSVPHQKEKRVIASETLKDIKKREEKPLEDKKEKSKTLPLQKQPFQLLDLEPFPFQPQTPVKHRPAPCPPPPKPSKFIKGEFVESDYESEFESHIPPKWRPYESDTEELTYRRVKPPLFTHSKRPKSTEPAPLPPSSFEKPLQSHEILRPVIDKSLNVTKEIKSTSSKKTVSASTTKSYALSKTDKVKRQQTSETSEKDLPVVLKPGSPPEYVQAIVLPKAQESQHQIVKTERVSPPKYKLDSSKSKTKPSKSELPESGYMADTDEPRQFKSAHHKSTIKHEESFKSTVEKTTVITGKTIQQSSHSTAPTHTNKSQTETKIITQPHSQPQQMQQHEHHQVHKTQQKTTSNIEKAPPSKFQSAKLHHKHLENKHEQKGMSSTGSTKSKKEIISTFTSEVQKEKKDIKPVPVKPVHPGPPVKQYVRHSLPSPSKFVKGEFRESDYESDYESRIPAKWRPGDSDADEPKYKPVHPLLAQKGFSQSPLLSARTPTPPTEFDNPPEFSAPPRPKFEPIEKPSQSCKTDVIRKSSGHHQKVFKPKPITPKTVPPIIATPDLKSKESEALKPGPCPEIGYAPPPPPKTKINIAPFEKATQIETSKIMNISESTEHMHRVVNVQQTTHVIRFGEKEREVPDQQSETFPFKTDLVKHRTKRPVLTTPKKFVPGDFYESEYESDLEAVKIKPKWTPGNSDTEEPHYRKVRPPQITHSTKGPLAISSSQPPTVSTESNLAATTNTTQAISIQKGEVQKKNVSSVEKIRTFKSEQNRGSQPIGMEITRQQDIQLQPGEPPEFCFAGNVASVASYVTSKHMSDMTNTFRSKAQQFASDIMTDVGNSRPNTQPEKIITKQDNSKDTESEKCLDDPQAYREESRVSEYGTKHIDPDTGLIYFKYDFGYEFGIVLPNEGKKQEGSTSKYPQIDRKQAGDIEVPVIHEKNTKGDENITSKATETKTTPGSTKVPQFKPKKFTHFKAVKWEPASESEMSEAEGDSAKMKKSYISPQSNLAIQKEPHIHIPPTQWGPAPTSPLSLSLSPSLPSLSPCTGATLDSTASPGGSWQGLSPIKSPRVGYGRGNTPTPPSTPSTPRSTSGIIPQHFCKPPSFITTLRDITVMKGQPVCFECIVQAEPPPNILWAKDGRLLENSLKHQLHFRNGVCRLTLSQASPEDSGNYTCTATNKLGTVKTSGLLQVPEVTLHFEDQDEAEKEYFAHWKATNVWSDFNIHSSDETRL